MDRLSAGCVSSVVAAALGVVVDPVYPMSPPPTFTDEAIARGIEYHVTQGDWNSQFGCGVAFVDLDQDGDPDLVLLGESDGIVGVYENDGAGVFTDRSTTTGIAPQPAPSGVVAADYDGDGDRDLYVTNNFAPNTLLRNDGGFQFTDLAEAAGVDDDGPGMGCAWGDYDADGLIDLYVANRNWEDELSGSNRLYRNLGNGTFTDVAAQLGVGVPDEATLQPVFFDFDRDADLDLYLSSDKGHCPDDANHLFENIGGVFVEITELSGTAACIDSMGIGVGDFDGNGLLDLYCTNVPQGNPLFMNLGGGLFSEQSVPAGVASYVTGWGASFLDFDHDGLLDLFVCNEFAGNRLYHGGPWPCVDFAPAVGMDDAGDSFCMAVADIDDDGDLDILVQNLDDQVRLYVNRVDLPGNHWAKFRVSGTGGTIDGIGAHIDVRSGTTSLLREISAGSNYKSQNEMIAHFGLGPATVMDEVNVTWPGGATRVLHGLDVDRTWWIHPPGEGGDANGDGQVNVDDLTAVILSWGPCIAPPFGCNADLTGDGAIDVDDLLAVVLYWG